MREKRHWETQIVNLGGANYKRGAASMTDEDGREVPGTRGYKWVRFDNQPYNLFKSWATEILQFGSCAELASSINGGYWKSR